MQELTALTTGDVTNDLVGTDPLTAEEIGKKVITVKADRDLFRHVIMAMKAGRDIDIDKVLQQELCPAPLSQAKADRRLRLPRNKAALGKILHQGLPQAAIPPVHPTCTIVDGVAMVQALGNRVGAKTFG